MESEWKTVRLGDYADTCLGKMLDKNKNQGTLHPYLGNKDVRWGRFELQDLSQMKFQEHEHDRYGLLPGDLVVCEGGEPGRCAIWKNEVSGMKIQKALHRIRPFSQLNNTYLHYWFTWSGKIGLLEPFFTGTTIKHLTGRALADLQLPLPPLHEQKAIAHILGSLDDKIELNRRMNATLEGMAQALFKSWFVDFDPVIDNALVAGNPIPKELAERAEVRRQALADGTANRQAAKQFPTAFQLTEEIGWIPEGWEKRPISECFQLIGGHSFKSSGYVEDGRYGVVTIKNVQDGKFVEECTSRITILPDKMKDHCKLNAGDVLLSLTGNVGRVCIVSEGSYVLNQRVSKIVGIDSISESFAYFFFRQGPLYEKMIVIAKGTAQQNLSPIETAKLKQVLPDNKAIRSLSSGFDAIFKKRGGNIAENMTLQKLRDTLLPKLISGELRIPEVEKLTEEALA